MKQKIKETFLTKTSLSIYLVILLFLFFLFFWSAEKLWCWSGWSALSSIALIITAIFIYGQTRATKEMVKFQWVPRVAVGMVSGEPQCSINKEDEKRTGTHFVFYNYTEAMVWVWRKIDIEIDGKKINKTIINQILGDDLSGKNPLPVKGTSKISTGYLITSSYDFLLNIIRKNKIDDIKDKTITARLEYWSAYNNKKQKNPMVFGPIPYYFDLKRGGWIIGGGLGMPFDIKP